MNKRFTLLIVLTAVFLLSAIAFAAPAISSPVDTGQTYAATQIVDQSHIGGTTSSGSTYTDIKTMGLDSGQTYVLGTSAPAISGVSAAIGAADMESALAMMKTNYMMTSDAYYAEAQGSYNVIARAASGAYIHTS